MYLKSIKAHGFKSFATKTEIELQPGITGVVGPNGSGKSNIVDAVKWVLGEQSAKSLRATSSMTDVIFSGSKSRDSLGRALVSLTFDNSDHYLNSDLGEIEIKRVLYQSGENDYFINNIKVRLKDITDLFLDSGASKESFNIISQGSITDIINSRPEERRVMFESAAGVLKYKKRKEDSLRKLERTGENLHRIELIVKELESTITPLKEQASIALQHNEYKTELESIEIALLADEITALNDEYQNSKDLIEKLSEEIEGIDTSNSEDNARIEKLKSKVIKIEENISKHNSKMLELTENLASLGSQKQITIERQKMKSGNIAIHNNLLILKEEELNLKKNISLFKTDINLLEEKIKQKEEILNSKIKELNEKNILKNSLTDQLINYNKKIYEYKNKISILEDVIENDTRLPYAVKAVLNNPRLRGVHNIIGKLIDVEKTYSLAIETALGYSSNVIVVDNEESAKECVSYLKDNKLGRATFFPLNIIKPKYIDESTLNRLSQIEGYVGIASELIKYDLKYSNIIQNQLGNVIIVKNIDTLNMVGRIVEYRYKIVSLEGELLHTGGSITGGSSKNISGVLNQKFELENLQKDLEKINKASIEFQKDIKIITEENDILNNQEFELQRDLIELKESLNRKNITLKEYESEKTTKSNELDGMKNAENNSLGKELEKILENYSKTQSEKEVVEKELTALKEEKNSLNDQIMELESNNRRINSDYNKKVNELKSLEINVGKMDVKLDNYLNILSENYTLTYEKAKENYSLDLSIELARTKVNSLKASIKSLGDVNTGAIAEYERLNKRYSFLEKQQKDLNLSIENLLEVISEMDEEMKIRFAKTFEKVNEEFAITFKQMFKGGLGALKLTDPDNLLETGVEIVASPPGKNLKSISVLSGGEKTLTAIALLFAILNVKPAPFCILDEVEAALDEPNVDQFCKYLIDKKNKSQFIIITHKKRTMEYVDILYGITMQESGVSKLVSVALDKIT